MSKERIIIDLIRQMKTQNMHFHFAEVTEVTGVTCSVKLGDLVLSDVRLMATDHDPNNNGLIVIPKVGSTVVVADDHQQNMRSLFVVMVDEPSHILFKSDKLSVNIDAEQSEVVFNDGTNGGLTNTPELNKQLDRVTKKLDTALKLLENVSKCTMYPNDAWAAYYQKETAMLENEDYSKIEDKNIRH